MPLRAFEEIDATTEFLCSKDAGMVEFLNQHAQRYKAHGYARIYVSSHHEAPLILGFYTLSMAAVQPSELSPEQRQGKPSHAVPVALLGKLARDDRSRGVDVDVAKNLVADAIRRSIKISKEIGCVGMLLHAKNERLVQYYKDIYGFVPVNRTKLPRAMFLPFKSFGQEL